MAAVYSDVEIEWAGEKYTVTPTYSMIQAIEQHVSIAGTAGRIARGDPPVSHMAFIVAYLLRAAGAKDVKPDDVYAEMTTGMDSETFSALATVVVSGFVPQRAKPGKPEAAAEEVSSGGTPTKSKA